MQKFDFKDFTDTEIKNVMRAEGLLLPEYLNRLAEQQADDEYSPDTELDFSNEFRIWADVFDGVSDCLIKAWKEELHQKRYSKI